jgi:hypothetical protein
MQLDAVITVQGYKRFLNDVSKKSMCKKTFNKKQECHNNQTPLR